MSNETAGKKAKERSPNFPFISLANALERARQFMAEEKRGSAPFTVAAGHWGYSSTSSGAMQTAAALKSYGLISDEGSGPQRKVRLTDLALRILLDDRPNSIEREQYKRQAALSPTVAVEIYQKWPDSLPSEANLRHYLILERGFKPETAAKVVSILQENESVTNPAAAASISGSNYDKVDTSSMESARITTRASSTAGTIPNSVRVERLIDPDSGIDVVLQFGGEPTIKTYDFIKDYIELRLKRMREKGE